MVACSSETPAPSESENTNEPIEERNYNYLNGSEITDPELKIRRPIAIMVDNSKNALPQSGIERADIIYEMVTEGGITRLMAVYSDSNNVKDVGPVRSARDQFVQFMLPLNAIYVHIGTSIYASDMLNFYHYQDIDGLYLGVTSFEFDNERSKSYAHEHCWYTDEGLVKAGIKATGLSHKGNLYPAFDFVDYTAEPVVPAGGDATEISFSFSGYADAAFHYNSENNRYYKDAFGAPHMDAYSDTQLSFDNVLVLNTAVALYPDGLCTYFDFTAGGEGYYFYGGKYIPVVWTKGNPENPLQIFDTEGNIVEINVGKTYVAVIDDGQLETLELSGAVQNVENDGEIASAE